MLRAAGGAGCTNIQLWSVAHAAHSRIADLRAQGHLITCTRERVGVYRYVLVENPQAKSEISRGPTRESNPPSFPADDLKRTLPLFDGLPREASG